MSCTSCNKSNCTCSDNCPNRVSDITTFDCNNFNVIEVPCDASLCDVLALLEAYTTNMVSELSDMTTVSIEAGNCIKLAPGKYGVQQVIDAILSILCSIPSCPLFVSISVGEGISELVATASGGIAPYTYQWSIQDNEGDVSFSGSTTSSSVTLAGTAGLNKFGLIKCTIMDDNGCLAGDVFLWRLPLID
jgi:hypothetical protein